MGQRWRSNKALWIVTSVLGVALWAAVGSAAAVTFEGLVTVPYCRDACRAQGTQLEHYHAYTRREPREACVCGEGQEVRPGFLRSPVGFVLIAVVLLPMAAFFAWANARDKRAAAQRARRAQSAIRG